MCGWSSAWWIWLNGKEKIFVRQANGKGFKLYQSMLHPDSRHIQQRLSVKIDFDTFRFSVSKTRISIERAQWKPQENPQWRRHKNQTFDESKISRWCVDYIFLSLALVHFAQRILGIQTKFKSFWRKYLSNGYKLSQLPLHRTTCVAIFGASQFLTHVPVYVSLNNDRRSTETFERQSNRWFSTSVNWPFTVLRIQLLVQHLNGNLKIEKLSDV